VREGPASPPLVGRRDDVAALTAAFEAAQQGRMAAVFLTGEAGVGKTRLVQDAVVRAADAGATVLVGGATDIAESPPFWPVASALRVLLRSTDGPAVRRLLAPWAAQLDELVSPGPAGRTLVDPNARMQTLELLRHVVVALAGRSAVVLVVEDVQWADRSTLDLLAYLVANLADERVLILASHRTDGPTYDSPARGLINELARHRQVRCLEVRPLRRADVAQLVRVAAPGRADLVDLVWARSEGNAFIAGETLRAALGGDPDALSMTLRELVLSRIGRLPPAVLRVVRAVAVCDGPLPHRLLEAVLDGAGTPLLDALREAVDAGVVVVDPGTDGYRLRHGLFTDVVVGELLPGERTDLHRRYAVALENPWARELPGIDARRAHHWHAAGDAERALAAGVAAAEAADRVRGYAEATRHWLRAARLAGAVAASTVTAASCLARAAEAAHLAGDADQAVALVSEQLGMITDAGGREAALLHARAGQYLVAAGRGTEASLAFRRAIAALPASGADRDRAEVLGGHAAALWAAGDLAGSREAAEAALAIARRAGMLVEEARALATLGFSLAYLEDPVAGERALVASLAAAERAADPREIGRAHRSLAELLCGPLNEMDRGIDIARTGADRLHELGLARSAGAGLLAVGANGLFRSGRWDEADAVIAEAWALSPAGVEALELRLARARIGTGRGRFADAENDLEAVAALSAASTGPRHRIPMLTLRAGLAMWHGRPDLALDHVEAGLDVVDQGSDDVWLVAPLVWHGARALAELARLGLRRADTGLDARLARHAAALTAQAATSVPAVRAVVGLFARQCDAEDGRAKDRSDPLLWADIAREWDARGQPYPAAYAHYRQAEAQFALRAHSATASEALRRAEQVARRLGAAPLLTEITELAQRARVRFDTPVPAPRRAPEAVDTPPPADELAALTARELEVLMELAGGHTNREVAQRLFISEKTVSAHVGRIYTKLGVRSRVQASTVLFRARPDARSPF
jgi:DNA-binding CsgD family transcriptional regulator/tetratricopeptide (TPR) repeat protein